MSDADQTRWAVAGEEAMRRRLGRAVFGDRIGLFLFLASVSLFAVYWLVDWRINDSLTLLNALSALADGSLQLTEPVYGQSLETPGVAEHEGNLYGRNYGILAVSLVPLVALRALGAVADLRIAVTGLWVLSLLATTLLVGRAVGRRRAAATWGSVGALVLFGTNLAVATDLDPARSELYALQVTHLVAAGLLVVVLYRLLARIHGRKVGLFAGALLVLGTPLGLWATIPKRHVITALVAVVAAYALYRGREPDVAGTRQEVGYRAGAYVSVGLLAWVHAPEALTLLVVLALVDLPTGPRRDPRTIGAIGLAFLVSLLPFFVTNTLAFGSPIEPPRLAGAGDGAFGGAGAEAGGPPDAGGDGGGSGSTSSTPILIPFLAIVDQAATPLTILGSQLGASLRELVDHPTTAWEVFVRSGYLDDEWAMQQAGYEAANLSLVESGPIVAAIAGVATTGVRAVRHSVEGGVSARLSPTRTVDAYVLVFSIAFTLLYLGKLPLNAQITLRYLFPLFPALVYGIVRLPHVRGVARDHARLFGWTVAAGVLLGGQLVVAALALLEPGRGEAFQFHALLALATTVPLSAWAVVGRQEGWWGRAGAVCFGLAAAATTVFLFLLTVEYWPAPNGPAIPVVRSLADVVEFL